MSRLGPAVLGLVIAVIMQVPAAPAWAQWLGPDPYNPYDDTGTPPWPGPSPYQERLAPPVPIPYGEATPANPDEERIDPQSTRQLVSDPTGQPAGTIVIDTRVRKLYLVLGGGRALEYGIGVGRQGFEWKGMARVGRKAEWPTWIPPADMLKRRPDLPRSMDGGLENPLGARALYLFQGKVDTLFRIHGTNEPDSIGHAVSSGCIRMMNADVIDLYGRVAIGTRVVVL